MKKILTPFLFLVLCFDVSAQGMPQDSVKVDSLQSVYLGGIDYENIELPPIAVFLEAANSCADVKFLNEKIEESKLQLKMSKKDWLKYFRILGNYQYGTNSSYYSQIDELLPPIGSSSLNTQSWYNVGVGLTIPFDDLFTRKNKNDVIRSQIRQGEYQATQTLENRQLLILQSYNEVLKNLSLLKVRAEALALYNAQIKISERDFVNGRIDIISLSLERSRRATAMVEYQETRAALHNAVTILELLTKIKIIK